MKRSLAAVPVLLSLVMLSFWTAPAAWGEREDPVQWALGPGGASAVALKATVAEGWHL